MICRMAFKLPQEPIRNRREFVTYLAATACGVLVALSVERAGEWWKQRSELAEARANLRREVTTIRDNVRNWRARVPAMQQNYGELSDYTIEMIKTGVSTKKSLTVNWQAIGMDTSAWKASEATGAVAHMEYAEAKRYADLYDMQNEFRRVQSLVLDELAPVMGFFAGLGKDADPTRNQRVEDMRVLGERVRTIGVRLSTLDSLAKAVEEICARILAEGAVTSSTAPPPGAASGAAAH